MELLRFIARSPFALLVCALAGAVVGRFFPVTSDLTHLVGQLYVAFIYLAAFPLLVVVTVFGVKRTLQLPRPVPRFLMVALYALLMVAGCAVLGVLLAQAFGLGVNLDAEQLHYLGGVVQAAGGETVDARMAFFGSDAVTGLPANLGGGVLPDNFFKVLTDGKILGIVLCTMVLSIGIAWVDKKKSSALVDILDGIYRALEIIVSQVNLFIPILVFAMSAYFAATATPATLHAMGSFIALFVGLALLVSALALVFIWKKTQLPFFDVLHALKNPMLISLASANATASIPDTIHAMSARLGFSRGIVEFVVPASAVFVRSGAALYFAALAVFISHLYGQPPNLETLALIVVLATTAAFASSGHSGLVVVGFAAAMLHGLQLPSEAALALFVAIDHLCEGPRSLLSLMLGCVLIVLVSQGLPSERMDGALQSDAALKSIRLTLSVYAIGLVLVCLVLVALLIVLLGIGVGMR
jgi:aerobic C4-dicarboxylate transport protein